MCVFAGVEPAQVQERVENHLKSLLIKHFDPQKADSIFTVEGEVRLLIIIKKKTLIIFIFTIQNKSKMVFL